MASTNKTTNYELSQFIETDRPAWLTDYNGDMRTIDSTMKAISDVASGASGSISELTDRMSTAEGNITTNTNDIAALDARADALEAGAQSTAGTIANIQTEQTAQNLGIEAATELGYNLARPYDSASTYAVGAYVLFQNTLYKCITAVSTGEAFDPTKWLAIKATDEIAAGGYTLPVASPSTLGGVKIGDGLSIDNEILSIPVNFWNESTSSGNTNVFTAGTPTFNNVDIPAGFNIVRKGYTISRLKILQIELITGSNLTLNTGYNVLKFFFDFTTFPDYEDLTDIKKAISARISAILPADCYISSCDISRTGAGGQYTKQFALNIYSATSATLTNPNFNASFIYY